MAILYILHTIAARKMNSILFLILATTNVHCLETSCSVEGNCRTIPDGHMQICASAYWQKASFDAFSCVDGQFVLKSLSNSVRASPSMNFSNIDNALQTTVITSSVEGTTGHWACAGQQAPRKSDNFGTANYRHGGTMASVYDPGSYVFRCDTRAPENGFYVAVWTRYNASLIAQPAPRNCKKWLKVKNPKTGRAAQAMVIDRCASCVGVDHQTSDPTTPDSLVNGATIDLSPALWVELYDSAPYGVYDVEYDGPVYGGSWDGEPDALNSPRCS